MVKEIRYTTVKRVLDNLLEHPMLQNVTLEQVVRYTLRFLCMYGLPKMFCDKIENVEIHDFRGMLPCDLISIIQVKDLQSGLCMRSMTDTFTPGLTPSPTLPLPPHKDLLNNVKDISKEYIPPHKPWEGEPTFKTQGRIIFTSFPEGLIQIAYRAIPVDDDGYPSIIDNENYLAALEAYVKLKVFTIKFDMGKITAGVLQNAQQEYAWAAGCLDAEFTIPSPSEAQALMNMYNTLIPNMTSFYRGFKDAGDREILRRH